MKRRTSASESPAEALDVLKGLRIRHIGRACDLVWIHFGEYREVPDRKDGTKEVGAWALHLQTSWRITRDARIIVGGTDIHYLAESRERYNFDTHEKTLFDLRAKALNEEFEANSYAVSEIVYDTVGGFSLHFGPGYSLGVFPHASPDCPDIEFWRFFEPATESPHYVVGTESI